MNRTHGFHGEIFGSESEELVMDARWNFVTQNPLQMLEIILYMDMDQEGDRYDFRTAGVYCCLEIGIPSS